MSQVYEALFEQVLGSLSRTLRNQLTRVMKEGGYGKEGLESYMTAEGIVTAQALIAYAQKTGGALEELCKVLCTMHQYPNAERLSASNFSLSLVQKTLQKQVAILSKHIPHMPSLSYQQHTAYVENSFILPGTTLHQESSEGWVFLPDWKLFAPTYQEAVCKVFQALKGMFSVDAQESVFFEQILHYLEVSTIDEIAKKTAVLAGMRKNQENSCILLPVQLGKKHRGQVPSDTIKALKDSEIPLGLYEIGITLLTHPEVFEQYSESNLMYCLGDVIQEDESVAQNFPALKFSLDAGKELSIHFHKMSEHETFASSGIPTGYPVMMGCFESEAPKWRFF